MFRIERSSGDGNWDLMMASPTSLSLEDLRGPPEDANHNYPPAISPGNKSVFTGKRGWLARIRYDDTVIERFEWAKIPLNEFDPESDTVWGWKCVFMNRGAVNNVSAYPFSFTG